MEIARALDVKRILFLVVMLFVTLALPYHIYGANGWFDVKSILLNVSYNASESSLSLQFISHVNHIFPALLICAPCILWLSKARTMSIFELLGSAFVVTLVITLILLLFLPAWAVFPWFSGGYLAYVPEFIDLIPFSGLVFTTMVLLPLLWQVLNYQQNEDRTRLQKIVVAALSVLVLLFPLTIENRSWQGTDINQNYFEGFSLFSTTSNIMYRVSGNRWGQGTWFHFSMSSIYEIMELLLLVLPGIVFVWFVCRQKYSLIGIASMIVSGTIHLLLVSFYCTWINDTTTHAGTWIMSPFPVLLAGGVAIAFVNGILLWNRKRMASITNDVLEESGMQQVPT